MPSSFIALAVTPWHALGVEAYVAARQSALSVSRSTIIIEPYHPFGQILTPDDFPRCRREGASFLVADSPVRFLDHVRAGVLATILKSLPVEGPPVEVVAPRDPVYITPMILRDFSVASLRNVRWVVIDEGMASYNYQVFPKAAWLEKPGRRGNLKSGLLRRLWRLQERWVRASEPELRYVFELGSGGKPRLNRTIAPFYLEAITSMPRPTELVQTNSRAVALLLTEPGAHYGWYSSTMEDRILDRLARVLSERGYVVLIKPHPSQQVERYKGLAASLPGKALVLSPRTAVERYAVHLSNKDIVVGFTSGALLTIRLLFGRETYTAASLALEDPELPGDSQFREVAAEFEHIAGSSLSGNLGSIPKAGDAGR